VDVQDDRLEASVIGWGMDEERWVVDHEIFRGDPSLPETVEVAGKRVVNQDSPWARLLSYLQKDYDHTFGVRVHVSCALIDSGGHHTQRVYDFCKKHEARRWFAIIGRAGIGKSLVSRGSEQGPSHAMLFTVGVDTAKEDIYTSLNLDKEGAGYTHFCSALQPEYFRQLTSEQLVKTKKDFVTRLEWVKKGERNEALDCAVYARAAVAVLRPAYKAIQKGMERAAQSIAAKPAAPDPVAETEAEPKPAEVDVATFKAPQQRRRQSGWVRGWQR
jgi:phage terminase large subunit GpA-like protein